MRRKLVPTVLILVNIILIVWAVLSYAVINDNGGPSYMRYFVLPGMLIPWLVKREILGVIGTMVISSLFYVVLFNGIAIAVVRHIHKKRKLALR